MAEEKHVETLMVYDERNGTQTNQKKFGGLAESNRRPLPP
jgi:hypothetical protein